MRSETFFEFDGDLILVDAILAGPRGQTEVRLVLDTGAALTTVIPAIAEAIGYTPAARIARSVMRTATASEHGYIVRLVRLSTLGFTVAGVYVDVADLGHDIDGVLGMNFLRNFNLEIRPAELRILAEQIAH